MLAIAAFAIREACGSDGVSTAGSGRGSRPDEDVGQARGVEGPGDLADDLRRRRQELVDVPDDDGLGRGAAERRERPCGEEAAREPHDEDRLRRPERARPRTGPSSTARRARAARRGSARPRTRAPRRGRRRGGWRRAPPPPEGWARGSVVRSSSHGANARTRSRPPRAPATPPTWGSAPVRIPARIAVTRMITANRSNRFTRPSIGEAAQARRQPFVPVGVARCGVRRVR